MCKSTTATDSNGNNVRFYRTSIGVTNDEVQMSPPWKSMMTSKPVWAIIVAHFAENWGFYTLLTGMPTFMKDVLGNNISSKESK